jgi:hypothetical protein
MRKELPPIEAVHIGWRMAAKGKPGDSVGKNMRRRPRRLFGEMVDGNKQTTVGSLGQTGKVQRPGAGMAGVLSETTDPETIATIDESVTTYRGV